MKKTPTTILVLTVCTILVIVVLSAAYLMYVAIRQENTDASATMSQIGQLNEREKQSDQLRTLLTKNKDNIENINSYFIPSQGVVPFVEQVEGYAKTLSITPQVNQLDIIAGDEKDFKEELHLAITVRGDWAHVFQFLKLYETLPYSVDIKTVRLTRSAKIADPNKEDAPTISSWDLFIDSNVLKLK